MYLLRHPNNVTEFALLGLMQNPHLQKSLPCLSVHFSIHCAGQSAHCHHHLPQPCTFCSHILLSHLLVLNRCFLHICCYTQNDLLYQRRITSWSDSLRQIFLVHFLGGSDIIVLTVMAYDHYVGI